MTSVRTTETRSLLFRYFTIPFLFLLVIAWALDGLFAYAEPPIGSIPSHEKSLSVPAIVAKVRPSVVTILTRDVPATPTQAQSDSGPGAMIDGSGYILTNNHLATGIKSLVDGLSTGRLTPGRVVVRAFLLDQAFVKITATDLIPTMLNPSPVLEIGDSVLAIGNPLALNEGSTVTAGVVSTADRSVLNPDGKTLYDLIQTDAAINPDNSGGPLADLSGHVIGINVAIAPSAQAISYAISMDATYPHIQLMIGRGLVLRPDLGFAPVTITPSIMASFWLEGDRGDLALHVEPAELTAVAGLQNCDIITPVGQHPIYNPGNFWHSLRRSEDQPALQLSIQRKNAQSAISLQNPSLPKAIP